MTCHWWCAQFPQEHTVCRYSTLPPLEAERLAANRVPPPPPPPEKQGSNP